MTCSVLNITIIIILEDDLVVREPTSQEQDELKCSLGSHLSTFSNTAMVFLYSYSHFFIVILK